MRRSSSVGGAERRSSAEFLRLCPHRCNPVLDDIDDCVADLSRRKDASVYKPTPPIDRLRGMSCHPLSMNRKGSTAVVREARQMSALGTDRLCRQVREHFRCWR